MAFTLLQSDQLRNVLYDRDLLGDINRLHDIPELRARANALIGQMRDKLEIYNDEFHKDQNTLLDMMDAFIEDHE